MARNRQFGLSVLFALAITASPGTIRGQEPQPAAISARVLADFDGIARARRLAAYGAKAGSPDSLVEAARILIDIRPRDCCRDVVEPEDPGAGPDESEGISVGSTPTTLLAAARTLAVEGSAILEVIEELEPLAEPPRTRGGGASRGPWKTEGRVPGESSEKWEITFDAGTAAIVRVIGDGDTNLDLFVYDAGGAVIASDDDLSDDGQVQWTPTETRAFEIVIANTGATINEYWLITN